MRKILALAAVSGLVITVITGFINTTPSRLLGAVWYGWPLAWRFIPVVPNPVPSYNAVNFIADFIVWFIIAFVILFAIWKLRKK